MPAPRKPPRLTLWRGEWFIFLFDHLEGKAKRVRCLSLHASTEKLRAKLLQRFTNREHADLAERWRLGVLDYDRLLLDTLKDYLDHLDAQAKTRRRNPAARQGLKKSSAYTSGLTIRLLTEWLRATKQATMTCRRLSPHTLTSFLNWVAQTPVRRGPKSKVMRGAATMNRHRAKLGACLTWIDALRPRVLPDAASLLPALKMAPAPARRGVAYTPAELRGFLKAARADRPAMAIKRRRKGRVERFLQKSAEAPSTPVDRFFLLCALTGCRRSEAENLKWAEINLDRGHVVFNAEGKTGRWRLLPLKGAPEGDVAPNFLKILAAWRNESPKAEYVLPHKGIEQPLYPRRSWDQVVRACKHKISPQRLRSSFTSYAASMGIPPAVCALWQGHSLAVAERHYRQLVLDRVQAASMEAAMGLS